MRKWSKGHSLLELLIAVAIIGILMAMYMSTLWRAQAKAKGVVTTEGMRQSHIGRMADNANGGGPGGFPERAECRDAFHEDLGGGIYASRLLYVVTNDDEFDAYWNTLLRYDADEPLEFSDGGLVATERNGETHLLPPMDGFL